MNVGGLGGKAFPRESIDQKIYAGTEA